MKYQNDEILKYRNKLNDFLSEKKGSTNPNQLYLFSASEDVLKLYGEIFNKMISFNIIQQGSKDTIANEDLKKFMNLVLVKKKIDRSANTSENIIDAISKVVEFIKEPIKDISSNEDEDMKDVVSSMLMLKTIYTILNNFNSQVGGSLMESFLGAIFGVNSIPISDGTKEVTDVKINGVPFSVKLIQKTTPIKGSKKNLENTLSNNNQVTYLVIVKSDGGLKFYSKKFNGDNVDKLLKSTEDEDTQFSISVKDFIGIADKNFYLETNINKIQDIGHLEKSLNKIKEKILPLYQSLDEFNKSLYEYFGSSTSTDVDINGKKLQISAKDIPIKSTEVTGIKNE